MNFLGSSDTNKKDHAYFYDMENIIGKRALITGGARGLGKAIAYALAKEGVHIAITGRNEAALKDTAAELAKLGTEVTYAVFDVSNYIIVQQEVEQLKNTFGSFDILINNAGVASFSSVLDMDVADWTSIIQTNLLGTYFVTKAVLPQLIEKNQGDIIMVSSTAGLNGAATTSAYSASKFGVIGFADSLMRKYGKTIFGYVHLCLVPLLPICPKILGLPMVIQKKFCSLKISRS